MRRVATGNPDSSFYSKLLQKCIDGRVERWSRVVHQQVISNGLGSDVALSNKLIVLYSKLGHLVNAQKLFDTMSERNIVSWTALLSGYSQNGYSEKALLVFKEMRCSGLKGNQFTYGSAFKACTRLLCLKLGKQIQGCVYKSRFATNVFVQSAVVDLYSKCGDLEDAVHVFESMSCRDLVCWNSMIAGLASHGMVEDSFHMFRSMLREGVSPDCFTFGSLLNVCAVSNSKVGEVHGFIIQLGFGSQDHLGGSLIDAYAKCGDMKSAHRVFLSLRTKDIFTFTNMITGYSREGSCASYHSALGLFCEIHRIGTEIDDVLLCSVVNVCADIASLSFGRQLHGIIVKSYPRFDVATGNALINMYGNCGEVEDANLMFTELEEKNVISWSSLIGAYAKHGYGHEAVSLLRKMECQGLKPNEITFLSLLFACSHGGLTNEAWEWFNIMIDKYGILPGENHYSCIIDLFARGGKLKEAIWLIKKMKIQPNAAVWTSILGACNVHGSVSLGEVAAGNLFDLEPKNATNYVVLASMYSGLGLWDNAWITRAAMEQRSLKKTPGYSYFHPMEKETKLLGS
ncbi:hypothetical protein V2J09_011656 [Rumex salicifolius]